MTTRNPDFPRPLVEMKNLLRRVHEYGYAEEAERVLALLVTDWDAAMEVLTGLTFWGGMGSFGDLYLCAGNGLVSDDFDRDNRIYRQLLLELYGNINAENYSTVRGFIG